MTLPAITFSSIFNSRNPIDSTTATQCVATTSSLSQVSTNRDFKHFDGASLADKVNSVVHSKNWMQVHAGLDSTSGANVFIIYHLLKHRMRQGLPGKWSISVGFDQTLFAGVAIGGDVNDTNNPFVTAALKIAQTISTDLKTPGLFVPYDGYGVIYDDISTDPHAINGVGTATSRRRTSQIAEFGWICQHNNAIAGTYSAAGVLITPGLFTFTPQLMNVPLDEDGYRIPRWGRPLDAQIVATTLQVT